MENQRVPLEAKMKYYKLIKRAVKTLIFGKTKGTVVPSLKMRSYVSMAPSQCSPFYRSPISGYSNWQSYHSLGDGARQKKTHLFCFHNQKLNGSKV